MAAVRLLVFALLQPVLVAVRTRSGGNRPLNYTNPGTQFCWKDTQFRGLGHIPKSCGASHERVGLLCMSKCPSGYKRSIFNCHPPCPAGWKNRGFFCKHSGYGRGAGYVAWAKKKCNRKHSDVGGCEKHLAMWYPKCKPGYRASGCCICKPPKPNCKALGMKGGIGRSCTKKIRIGKAHRGVCSSSQDRNAGLCYKKCKNTSYRGVGPVCWGRPPAGWVNCGMGAAADAKVCSKIMKKQVKSVVMTAATLSITIGTLGAAQAGMGPVNAAQNAGKFAELKEKFEKMKKSYEALKKSTKWGKTIKRLEATEKVVKEINAAAVPFNEMLGRDISDLTAGDMVRIAAEIAAIVDTTGIAATVAAFSYPKCGKISV